MNILVLLLSLTKQTSNTIKKKKKPLILTQGVRGLSPCPLSPTLGKNIAAAGTYNEEPYSPASLKGSREMETVKDKIPSKTLPG